MANIVVAGCFDDPSSRDLRFLDEASRRGPVTLVLWADDTIRAREKRDPKCGQDERAYFFGSMRYVDRMIVADGDEGPDALPDVRALEPDVWVVDEKSATPAKDAFCRAQGIEYRVVPEEDLNGYPEREPDAPTGRKKVVVTGCYDWFHSGHVRFFEETSELGDLHVVVGHDANIKLLKGEGHPMFTEDKRRYMAQSVRFVSQAYVSSGHGWMDAEPEIERIRPDVYAVNEDGDVPEKRAFCEQHGLEYVVLKRLPKDGLVKRSSTDLRGF